MTAKIHSPEHEPVPARITGFTGTGRILLDGKVFNYDPVGQPEVEDLAIGSQVYFVVEYDNPSGNVHRRVAVLGQPDELKDYLKSRRAWELKYREARRDYSKKMPGEEPNRPKAGPLRPMKLTREDAEVVLDSALSRGEATGDGWRILASVRRPRTEQQVELEGVPPLVIMQAIIDRGFSVTKPSPLLVFATETGLSLSCNWIHQPWPASSYWACELGRGRQSMTFNANSTPTRDAPQLEGILLDLQTEARLVNDYGTPEALAEEFSMELSDARENFRHMQHVSNELKRVLGSSYEEFLEVPDEYQRFQSCEPNSTSVQKLKR